MATQSAIADEIRNLVGRFEPMLRELNDEDIRERPRPKKWARKEVLGHLIDSACNNQQKFVRMMQQPHLDFPGYAQDDWVDLQKWAAADWNTMVNLWAAYNHHVAYIIENVEPQHLANTITIEGAGPFTLEFIMPDYVEHMKHHLKQIFPDVDLTNSFVNVYGA
jgi:hypothetical protein